MSIEYDDKIEFDEANEDAYNATELAKVADIKLNGTQMNIMLVNMGLMEDWFEVPREEWGDDFRLCPYRLTKKGKKYSAGYFGAFNGNIICWKKDVIPLVQAEYKRLQEKENNERLARTGNVLDLLNKEMTRINDSIKFDLDEIQEIKIESRYRYDLKSKKVKETLHIYYNDYKKQILIKNDKWRKVDLQNMLKNEYLKQDVK